MWGLFQHAKTWNCRPSSLLGVVGVYEAFCLDEAVAIYGHYIEAQLDKITGKPKEVQRKQHNLLLKLLDAPAKQRFRSMRPKTATKATPTPKPVPKPSTKQ